MVFRPLVNQRNDTIAYSNSFWNQYFSVKVVWVREREREKWGFISYLSAWGSDRHVCLKMGTHESISVAHGQR